MAHKKVVTRFAPSPTGFLHVGSARTAIYSWLYARQQKGEFILRIEDTDKAREVEGAIQHIIDSLTWIGLDWDYGPDKPAESFGSCLQSDRLEIYKKYAHRLLNNGLAYPDPYSEEEVAEMREADQKNDKQFLFRNYRPATLSKDWDETTPLRFKVPEIKRYTWQDEVRGELSAGEEMLDDFILIKTDGFPTYNFAHVVDDHEMKVTHVMRGEEFISSMPKFLSLIDALEFERPSFVTLPPIMGPDGKKKLSKRDGAKDLLDFKADGYLPEAMLNFLALIGWNPGTEQEKFTKTELTEQFTVKKIQRSGGAFNTDKLDWLNKEHLTDLSVTEKIDYIAKTLPKLEDELVAKLTPIMLERAHNAKEVRDAVEAGEYAWALDDITYKTDMLAWKNDSGVKDALPRLKKVEELLKTTDFNSPEDIKKAIWSYAEEIGKGEVLWPVRVALSGQERSPDPFTLAFVLGKTKTLSRIEEACDKIEV